VIVTCENCDTRFNLDENLVKESGSKVRCSRCHHIFTVHKLAPVEEPNSALEEAPADFPDTAEVPPPSFEAEEAPEDVLDFDLSKLEEEPAEEEISLEELGLEEGPAAEEPAPVEEEIAVEEISEAVEAASKEATAVSGEAPEEVLDLDLSELEEEPAEEEISLEEFGLEEGPAAEEPALVEEEIDIEETPEAVEAEPVIEEAEEKDELKVESLEGAEEEEVEPVEEELMPPPVAKKELQARKRISTPLMIVLVLALLVGGALAAYNLLKSHDVKIPFLESLIGAPESATTDPGNLRITTLEQVIKTDFVENRTAGRLFVIKGKVRNDYPEARSFIMAKGVLYSKDGKAVQEETVYCGNTLSDTDLQALDKATIYNRLRNRFGDEKSNFRVPSGKVIPLVLVFSDLPQDLGEFSVEVVSSAPG
jgi:predicted Zn finger-like uncharacterized protein